MDNYPTFARFANLRDDQMPAETQVLRMPDGSLIMRGAPAPRASMLDRLKGAASQFISMGNRSQTPEVPWWIAGPTQEVKQATAPVPVQGGKVDPWAAIEKEAAHEEAVRSQLGDFSKKVLASPQLMEGRWITGKVPQ